MSHVSFCPTNDILILSVPQFIAKIIRTNTY